MEELAELARSSGIAVADRIIQRQQRLNPKYLLGRGKLSELVLRALQLGVDLLVFDQDLNPSQVRSITDFTELRVVDRTQLILDIFAQRAKSREGKIQVEMAQLKYMLPRLVVKDDALSRLTGGIGGRGPGETKLEINRRRVRDRIARLEKQLSEIKKQRGQRRGLRLRTGLPIISVVGYTNAGKSTLLNVLTNSRVQVGDSLFATLDPASRRLRFPRDQEAIITDTVGFIRDLPAELMEAFGATLEELRHANLLLHVIDLSNPMFEEQIHAVEKILEKLGLHLIPMLRVFNKMDLVKDEEYIRHLCRRNQAIAISALNGDTLRPLVEAMEARLCLPPAESRS
jgi:GTP-binding protein HflX